MSDLSDLWAAKVAAIEAEALPTLSDDERVLLVMLEWHALDTREIRARAAGDA